MPRPVGSPKVGGRAKGTPNKSTSEFRQTVTSLLHDNRHNVAVWLYQVAYGQPEHNIKPAPEKALDLLAKLAEYAAPKLNRTVIAGDQDAPLKTVIAWE